MAEDRGHETDINLATATTGPVEAGSDVVLTAMVSCSPCGDLRGGMVRIIAQDGTVIRETALVSFDGSVNETDELVIEAPGEPGEHMWTAVFPAQDMGGIPHQESAASFSFVVRPHATSISVWGAPHSVPVDNELRVKIGARCSAGCSLAGREIEVYDHEGTRVATATLGDALLPGEPELSCVEVELQVPSVEGRYRWTVKLPKTDQGPAHEGASATFGVGAAKAPEHEVTVVAVEKDTGAPAKNAFVRLRPRAYGGYWYQCRTDDAGVARIGVPKDDYQLYVSADGKEVQQPSVKITSDVTIRVELTPREPWWANLQMINLR